MEKGTILIVEDRMDEKIGKFEEYLTNNGYNIQVAETLEKADVSLNSLIASNKLDGLILDFSFPTNSEDESVVSTDSIPNGISLLRKYQFKIETRRIPVIINTTADEDYKKKYLGDIKNSRTPMYNVDNQSNPLSQPTPAMVEQILSMFNKRTEERNVSSQIRPDNKWKQSGAFIRDDKGNIIGYR